MDSKVTILTIEDEHFVRSSLTAHLEDIGYQYAEAVDGREGLRVFEQLRPDLVLCDLRLPKMDGLDVLSSINRQSPDTPVIIVSGANQLSDAIQALKRGAWDYITKPITDFAILDSAISRALARAELIKENKRYQANLETLNKDLGKALDQLREDEETARALQRRLLPESGLSIGGYTFEHRLIPSMLLSGDFVDYFPIGDKEVGFYIADISGHGAASAFVTVMLKTLVDKYRQAFQEGGDDSICHPDVILEHLNRDILNSPIDKYLTIFYGVLSLREGQVRFASGGQFPSPMVERNGEVSAVTQHDKPVGLFDDSIYTVHRLDVQDVNQILMVSDGILELFPTHSARRRMEWLLEEANAVGLGIEQLMDRFAIEDRKELPDDVAFLSIRREGEINV